MKAICTKWTEKGGEGNCCLETWKDLGRRGIHCRQPTHCKGSLKGYSTPEFIPGLQLTLAMLWDSKKLCACVTLVQSLTLYSRLSALLALPASKQLEQGKTAFARCTSRAFLCLLRNDMWPWSQLRWLHPSLSIIWHIREDTSEPLSTTQVQSLVDYSFSRLPLSEGYLRNTRNE